MSGPRIAYVADFAVSMAIDKYAKVPAGRAFGSQLGVGAPLNGSLKRLELSNQSCQSVRG